MKVGLVAGGIKAKEEVPMLWIKGTIGFVLWLATASAFLSLFGHSEESDTEQMMRIRGRGGEREEKEAA